MWQQFKNTGIGIPVYLEGVIRSDKGNTEDITVLLREENSKQYPTCEWYKKDNSFTFMAQFVAKFRPSNVPLLGRRLCLAVDQ